MRQQDILTNLYIRLVINGQIAEIEAKAQE